MRAATCASKRRCCAHINVDSRVLRQMWALAEQARVRMGQALNAGRAHMHVHHTCMYTCISSCRVLYDSHHSLEVFRVQESRDPRRAGIGVTRLRLHV